MMRSCLYRVARCPECGLMFVAGFRATHCPDDRKKLKAWRRKRRRQVRRAKLGLHPGWRVARLKVPRRKPTRSGHYRILDCCDCGNEFVGGTNALRCVGCNDLHRREYQRKRDSLRIGSRDGRRRGERRAATTNGTRAT